MPELAMIDSQDLIEDHDLGPSDEDVFQHGEIVDRVAEILQHTDHALNVGVFGAWGTGKSSFLNRLEEALPKPKHLFRRGQREHVGFRVVRYDAWRYSAEALRRDLIAVASRQLRVGGSKYSSGLLETRQVVRIEVGDILRRVGGFMWGFFAFLVVATIVLALIAVSLGLAQKIFNTPSAADLRATLGIQAEDVMAAVAGLAALVNVPNLLGVTVGRSKPSHDDEFSRSLSDLLLAARVPPGVRFARQWPVVGRPLSQHFRNRRIVFLIDELDRAGRSEIITTLNALQTLLSAAGAYVVLAADRVVVAAAMDHESAKLDREWDSYRSSYESYFDKIFQLQFTLPPLRQERVRTFAEELIANRGGVWELLRDADVASDVVYVLVPGHVDSPRRVKVLLNAFATTCRVAWARELPAESMFLDIAQWSVLQNEFPTFAQDCLVDPRLKSALLGGVGDDSPTRQRLLARHAATERPEDDAPASEWVEWNRRDQLRSYLEQVSHVDDPPRSLLYLEEAGTAAGKFIPEVADLLDNAADVSASLTIRGLAVLDGQSSQMAAVFLASGWRNNRSTIARGRLLEVIASLVARIPRDGLVEGSVLAPALRTADASTASADLFLAALRIAVVVEDGPRVRQLVGTQSLEVPDWDLADHVRELESMEASPDAADAAALWAVRFMSPKFLNALVESSNPVLAGKILAASSGHLLISQELSNTAELDGLTRLIAESPAAQQRIVVENLCSAAKETQQDLPQLLEVIRERGALSVQDRARLAAVVVAEYGSSQETWVDLLGDAPTPDLKHLVSSLWAELQSDSDRATAQRALSVLVAASSDAAEVVGPMLRDLLNTASWHSTPDENHRTAEVISASTASVGSIDNVELTQGQAFLDLAALVRSGQFLGKSLALLSGSVDAITWVTLDKLLRTKASEPIDDQLNAVLARLEVRVTVSGLNRLSTSEVARVVRRANDADIRDQRVERIVELQFSTARTDVELLKYLEVAKTLFGVPLSGWVDENGRNRVTSAWIGMAQLGYGPAPLKLLARKTDFADGRILAHLAGLAAAAEEKKWRRSDELVRQAKLDREDVKVAAGIVASALANHPNPAARKSAVRLAVDTEQDDPSVLQALARIPISAFRRVAERALAKRLGIKSRR